MRFLSTSMRAEYVVRPATRRMNSLGIPEPVPGLVARFMNHSFDSEKAQAERGWSDDERMTVERHLLSHPDFDHGGRYGIFLDNAAEGKSQNEMIHNLPATAVTTRCIAFFRNESGEVEQCPREATKGDYCANHAVEMEEAEAEMAPAGSEG